MKRVVLAALIIAATLTVGFFAFDLGRPRYSRTLTRLMDAISCRFGVVLVDDPYRFSWPEPTKAYHVHELAEFSFCGETEPPSGDSSAAACNAIPELGVVLVMSPQGADSQNVFSAFEGQHPIAQRLPSADIPVPPFLVLQKGDGVEGLQVQLSLTSDGQLCIRERRFGMRSLQLVERYDIEGHASSRLFVLARESGLATKSTAEGNWGWLDGRMLALMYYDGSSVGRAQFLNNRPPSAALAPLARALAMLAVDGGITIPLGPLEATEGWWWVS